MELSLLCSQPYRTNRLSNVKTVPGTWSYHCFVPNPTEQTDCPMRRLCQAHGAITALFPTLQKKTVVVQRLSGDEPSFETALLTAQNEEDATVGCTPIGHRLPTITSSISGKQCEIGRYVGCCYDGKWWVRHIRDISEENEDVQISFMHPHGPARSLAGKRGQWAPVLFG